MNQYQHKKRNGFFGDDFFHGVSETSAVRVIFVSITSYRT